MSWTNSYSLFSEQTKILSSTKKSESHYYIKWTDTKILTNMSIPLQFKSAGSLSYHSEGQLTKSFFFSKWQEI